MYYAIARICVDLVFVAAGSTVTAEPACQPERWRQAVAKFERADQQKPMESGGVVFVGSSSIRLWNLPQSFPDLEPLNRGFGGSEICDATHYLDTLVIKHRPRVVVLYAGDNDVARGKSAEQVHRDFGDFWKRLHQELPATRLIYIAIKPSLARWKLAAQMQSANKRIAASCQADPQLTFVDIWQPMLGEDGRPRKELFVDDGLHLNAAGYRLWTDQLRKHLPSPSK